MTIILSLVSLNELVHCYYVYLMRRSQLFSVFFFLMIRRPPRSTQSRSSAASDVYKRQALDTLGSLQGEDGDFASFGSYNCESTSQVLLALSSLGVDPLKETRFIKNGNTVLDGLNKYKLEEGKYRRGDNYSEIATRQAEEALLSYNQYLNTKRAYYDLLPEFSENESQKIISLKTKIDAISDSTNLDALYQEYLSIPYRDRFYIYNYYKLEEKLIEKGIALNEEKEYPVVSFENLKPGNYDNEAINQDLLNVKISNCLLYTSPSPRDS